MEIINAQNTNTNEINNNIALTPEEIDELLQLIKDGKSLKDITIFLMKKFNYPRTIKIKEKSTPIQLSQVSLTISCVIKDKTIALGATNIINDPNITLEQAHEELYGKLLRSLENLITISLT